MAATMAILPLRPPPAAPPVQHRTSISMTLTPPSASPLPVPPQRASLYVGDLHPDVTEEDLLLVFSRVGPVSSVHLCRDRLSHKSLCYAYVNFMSHIDAETALSSLNYTGLRGKSMRIMWRQRDPITRKTGTANLFIKNLDPSITSARLQEIFVKYGEILSCKIAEENGKSKGFGFVQFDSEISAMAALNAVNGTLVEGKKLYVSKFIKKRERKDTELGFTNLYVKNLDGHLTEDSLKEKFSEYGKVCSAVIMKDEKGKSKGFGFVNFDTHEEAMNAIAALNGALIGSKNLFVGRAQTKADRVKLLRQAHGHNFPKSKASGLFVDNLEVSVDDRKLEEIFSCHGKVASANVIRGRDGVSKGCGFVSFTGSNDAVKAMLSLNGRTQNCPSKNAPQSFYTQNLDVTSEFYPLHNYNFPNYSPWDRTAYQDVPIPQLNSWDPNLGEVSFTACPNSGRPLSSFYGAQNCQGNLSTHIPPQQKVHGNNKNHMQKHLPRKFSISGAFTQNLMEPPKDKRLSSILQNKIINGVTEKDQKPSRKLQNKRINGDAEKFSQLSATTRPVSETC